MCLFCGEASNPYLVLRTLFKLQGMKGTLTYIVNDAIFAVTWLILRLLIGPYLYWVVLQYEAVSLFCKMGIASTLFISMIWNVQILGIVLREAMNVLGC